MLPSLTVLIGALATLTGCGKPEPARFHTNMVAAVNAGVSPAEQQHVTNILTALYGTPDEPRVPADSKLDLKLIKRAAGPVNSDIHNRTNGLYREHCVHCHGISGDGMGPTAAFLNPYPRDYRPGKYKFKSTVGTTDMPTDADLHKTLIDGIPGSSMPSFRLLKDDERSALVEYVKYLSQRGQTEIALYAQKGDLFAENEKTKQIELDLADTDVKEMLITSASGNDEKWSTATAAIVSPDAGGLPPEGFWNDPAVVDLGRKIYFDKALGNCVQCHGVSGLGDGQLGNYDDWTTETKKALDKEEGKYASLVEQFSLRPRNIIPRNLRSGIYRGGRRPIDLYYRIVNGINGSGMPAHNNQLKTEAERWAIVAYVLQLPYETGGALRFESETTAAAPRNTN